MSVQASASNVNYPFVLSGSPLIREGQTILQDGARATVLATKTVMAKIAASGKWVPLTSASATDGTATARGIYIGDDITAAALVAGDVTDAVILVGNAVVDESQLVIENSLTLATVVAGTTVNARTVSDDLASFGINTELTIAIDQLEN